MRAVVADHIRALQGGSVPLPELLYALTLQNAAYQGSWAVRDRDGYLRALGGAKHSDVQAAVDELISRGLFADYASVYRPSLSIPKELLAEGFQDKTGAHRERIGSALPSLDSKLLGAAA